ncbi:MAG: hypothetical protein MHPDNHAH_02573 [Anaerolineales bacterium]|nr:hypothetical protein [Anaerolineales bacterium]WKZ47982.1 MAG: hypothetical protein QY306_01280 [Anaerolineales bacterium]
MALSNSIHFPNNLRIIIRDQSYKEPIARIAVTLVVFAKRRNDYYLGLPLSDSQGIIEVNKVWIENAIDFLRNTFIMDYSSNLEECSPQVLLDVMSNDQIERAKSAMKLHKAEEGGLDIAYTARDLENTNNRYYENRKIYVLLDNTGIQNKIIEIVLKKTS